MVGIRHAAQGSTASLLRQVALSVAATLIATAILTEAQHRFGVLRPITLQPMITSGGKFAARVEAFASEMDDAILLPPAHTPLLLADVARPAPLPTAADRPTLVLPPVTQQIVDLAKPTRRGHSEPKRHMNIGAIADILPPRRADVMTADATAGPLRAAVETPAASGLWSATQDMMATTKNAMKQAVGFGGEVLEHIVPSGLTR